MNTIISALSDAIPFYIASIPIIILNMYIIKKKKDIIAMEYKLPEKIFTLAFILSLLFILSITIGNNSGIKLENVTLEGINMNPFNQVYNQYTLSTYGDIHSIINLFGNILIFIPWGFFLAVFYKENKNEKMKVLITVILTSLSIETIQLFTGRAADIIDIISNTIGALLGRLIFYYLNILFKEFFNNIHLRCPNNNKEVNSFTMGQVLCCLLFLVASILW